MIRIFFFYLYAAAHKYLSYLPMKLPVGRSKCAFGVTQNIIFFIRSCYRIFASNSNMSILGLFIESPWKNTFLDGYLKHRHQISEGSLILLMSACDPVINSNIDRIYLRQPHETFEESIYEIKVS